MLAEVNVWVDLIAIIMVLIPLGFWAFQIGGNFLTGRFYRKFKLKQWPHHDEVIPATPKVVHGSHVVLMTLLGVSGLYTRYPFFEGGREIMKWIHFVCMYAVVINAAFRVYYAVIKDGRAFIITLKDALNTPKVLMYYMFITKSYPHLSKYNVMQKMTYGLMFPGLMVIQAFTGFALMWPKPMLGWIAPLAGGVAAAAAWSRIIHFMSAMAFLMMTMIHMCLAAIEDFPSLLSFFGLSKGDDHGAHGHEPAHEPAPAIDGVEA